MKLTFIGHAGFLIESNDTLLVIDPWLSPHGAFDSAWLQFPCNHHLSDMVLKKSAQFKQVFTYISHEHKDHFDSYFLQQLLKIRPDITFLIPQFASKSFLKEVQALQPAQVIELSNDAHYLAKDMDIYLFMDESGINHDSGILVKAGGHSFLNLNDCKIFDRCEYIKNKFGSPDVFSVQFSGASWHPICYDMPESTYKMISKQKKSSKYRAVLNAIKTLSPKRYVPAAGPAALLDPMHYAINFQSDSIFPPQFDIVNFLHAQAVPCQVDSIMPGDVYCFATNQYDTLVSPRVTEDNFKATMEAYAQQSRHLFIENEQQTPKDLDALFSNYFNYLQAKAKLFVIPEKIQHELYFAITDIPERYIRVNLNEATCSVTDQVAADNYYVIAYPAWQIHRFLQGKVKGEDLALTFRGRMKRSPDVYNTWISCFINSELDNMIEHIELMTKLRNNNEKIIIDCNGTPYQIKRYCPHQGADLQYGWCEGNHWVCPKHRWRYDLENGGKCPSSNATIEALRLA